MSSSIYIAIPVMLVLGVVQTAVLPHFSPFNLVPQLPLLVALTWGMLRTIDEGIVWAFIGGLMMDFFSITPLGVTALGYMVAVTAVLWAQEALPTSRLVLPLLLATLATAISLIFNLILLRLFGMISTFQVAATLWPLVLINAVIMLPVYWLIYGIDRMTHPRRIQL